eukprot:gnl/TRDRNA2_/TRDRNA2_163780_c0_seq1.p1 gnl/TRDRNA2_/TRDRNA2_163780_c0~~gnl/TRDRNA2_/TRDRNA2_163780_c0_seq1.p1  ORF type:complete len:410 (+),score=98.43 gnl/TRDRNA2_/TRDRNA2_163780_c0_seq1:118-1347(+)
MSSRSTSTSSTRKQQDSVKKTLSEEGTQTDGADERVVTLVENVWEIDEQRYAMYKGPSESWYWGVIRIACSQCNNSSNNQASERKRLEANIRKLKERRASAAELMEQVEEQSHSIETLLKAAESKKERLVNSGAIGGKGQPRKGGAFGACCDQVHDIAVTEQDFQERALLTHDKEHQGAVETRTHLREKLEETGHSLAEAEAELRKLRQELSMAQRELNLHRGGKDEKKTHRRDSVPIKIQDQRTMRVKKFAAIMDGKDSAILRAAYLSWHQIARSFRHTDRIMKATCMHLSTATQYGNLEILFHAWKGLWEEKSVRDKTKREKMLRRFTYQFISQSDRGISQVVFQEWWKLVKERQADERVTQVQNTLDEVLRESNSARQVGSKSGTQTSVGNSGDKKSSQSCNCCIL